jgi:putative ABC transport system ATP-binding protein
MIHLSHLQFAYPEKEFSLNIESLEIPDGNRAALVGPSGCGKTTLLHLIAGILQAQKGAIKIDDQDVSQLTESQRRSFRISNIGFVFQTFELIEYLHVLDNVVLPFRINNSLKLSKEIMTRGRNLLASMGLEGKEKRSISHLSQGERQRVAICRSLIAKPKLLLADEPTGNLDPKNKELILDLLFQQATDQKTTVLMATHDINLLDKFNQVIDFKEFIKQ